MKISAVVCEYNPFHNGHRYLNETAKQNCDALISVMSSSFTQRGDVAICSKYRRAEAALRCGADLVVEFPAVYAVSCAEIFAKSAAAIIRAMNCVDSIVFGSECGDVRLIEKAAEYSNTEKLQGLVKEKMKAGLYYPKALSLAAQEILGERASKLFSSPNDILAIEYCKALEGSGIEPAAVKRQGAAHDSKLVGEGFASASQIRRIIRDGGDVSPFIPFDDMFENPAFFENIDKAVLYRLRTMTPEQIACLPDVSEGLENRIYSAARTETSAQEAMEKIKTKRYTMARIRRIFINALLGFTKEIQQIPVPYIRILGFTQKGAEIMSVLKKKADLPLVVNPAGALGRLSESGVMILKAEIRASDIFALAQNIPQPCGADFFEQIIKL